jgi:hypothetical protein
MCYLVHWLCMDGRWLDFQDEVQSLIMLLDPCQHVCVLVGYTEFIAVCLERMQLQIQWRPSNDHWSSQAIMALRGCRQMGWYVI